MNFPKSKISVIFLVLFVVSVVGFQTCAVHRKQPLEATITLKGDELATGDLPKQKRKPWVECEAYRNHPVKVAYVIDGDTVKLTRGQKLRYIGVDTPETKHPRKPVQYYGKEAYAFNKQLVEGKEIYIEFDVVPTDRYGRWLGYVFLADGTFVNALLVKQGYAKVYTYPPNVKYIDLFRKLETEARKNKRGVWGKGG